jgi:hypothetical protein
VFPAVISFCSSLLLVAFITSFSSPDILVRKKDETWRLCTNFCQLNALSHLPKYPIYVIDELLDEFNGASWFSKLDLRLGYHQIRLAPGEEHKTGFQIQSGYSPVQSNDVWPQRSSNNIPRSHECYTYLLVDGWSGWERADPDLALDMALLALGPI